jgi:hypothetical protein
MTPYNTIAQKKPDPTLVFTTLKPVPRLSHLLEASLMLKASIRARPLERTLNYYSKEREDRRQK